MFEKHKAKKAEEQFKSQTEAWQSEHDELTAVLHAATTRTGVAEFRHRPEIR